MNSQTFYPSKFLLLSPTLGIFVFIILYVVAAIQYPGGSAINPSQEGFSFLNNYWCDLIFDKTVTGLYNPGYKTAVAGMGVLCFSFIGLFFLSPKLFSRTHYYQKIIQVTGMTALFIACFLATDFHDQVITYAGLLGAIALLFSFIELKIDGSNSLFYMGVVCMLIGGINYYFYYSQTYLNILPFIQKIAFLSFLVWMALLNWKIYQNSKI